MTEFQIIIRNIYIDVSIILRESIQKKYPKLSQNTK